MSMEEGPQTDLAASHRHNHLLDWFEDSFITSLLEDPYTELNSQEWWNDEEIHTGLQMPAAVDGNSSVPAERPDLSKKRKQPASAQQRACEEDGEAQRKKKPGGSDGSKDARWAEQLLNSCVAAAGAGNLSRVQHLLFVLRELASPSGDANQRLASHGLRAISGHLASLGAALPPLHATAAPLTSYATAERQLFRSAVIKFHEASPWFTLPNALANAAIIHALDSQRPRTRPLHVIDIGVSHGMQWPTLLDALTRRPGGPPPLVRITVAGSAAIPHGPFSSAPPGYDSSAHLLRYAKSIDLNLHIDRADSISSGHLLRSEDDDEETLVVCAQFRIGHACMEARTAILDAFRGLEPELVVLSEVDWEVRQQRGGNGFLAGFPGRAKLLWSFLDSTAAAVKGRESTDRKVVEDEAAGWLEMAAEAEGAAEWRERMAAAGFREERFAEEVVETGRTLLRKYDSNWEMRPPEAAAAAGVGLWWKGQPVSFCSLWSIQEKI